MGAGVRFGIFAVDESMYLRRRLIAGRKYVREPTLYILERFYGGMNNPRLIPPMALDLESPISTLWPQYPNPPSQFVQRKTH